METIIKELIEKVEFLEKRLNSYIEYDEYVVKNLDYHVAYAEYISSRLGLNSLLTFKEYNTYKSQYYDNNKNLNYIEMKEGFEKELIQIERNKKLEKLGF